MVHEMQITRHNTTKLALQPNIAIYSTCVNDKMLHNASSETDQNRLKPVESFFQSLILLNNPHIMDSSISKLKGISSACMNEPHTSENTQILIINKSNAGWGEATKSGEKKNRNIYPSSKEIIHYITKVS